MTDKERRKKEKRFAYKVGDIICNIGQTNWWHKVVKVQGEQVTLTQGYSRLDPSFPECVQEDNSGMEVRTKDSLIDGYYHVMDMTKWRMEELEMEIGGLQNRINWKEKELAEKRNEIWNLEKRRRVELVVIQILFILIILYIILWR